MENLAAELLFEIKATLDHPIIEGRRIIAMINGGTFTGKMCGKVLPVGGEFGTFIPDTDEINETYKIDVRAAIQTDDNAVIYISYNGFMHAEAATLKMLFSPVEGPKLDPSTYYWRINPVFETASKQYEWLNHMIAVGYGSYTPEGQVIYKIYAIQ